MKMMGLKTWIYWLVTYMFSYMLYLIAAGLSIAIAVAMNFRYYRVNNFLSYFLLFFFWGHVMVATAFFLSVFFTKTRTATVVGYTYILFVGLFGPNLIAQYFNSDDTPASTIFLLSIFPPFAFYRGLLALGRGVSFGGAGITVADISTSDYQLDSVYYFLIVEWAILMVLAVYFENVLPIGPGVKEHPLFFLPKRWHWWQRAPKELMKAGKDDGKDPEDVVEERKRTLDVAGTEKAPAITIVGLNKVFPARDGMPPKVAVRALTMGINYGECLGFLGPNGAGKSTTINMLCGYLRPTSGRATINGLDILQEVDDVHLQMGICPQEDVLWDDLTGPEHLRFYGRLKNLRGKQLEDQVDYWLRQVNLHNDVTKFSRQYSGGMKRRLSVALALIGNPRVVLLDEPTTGLDPGSRRALWDVITNYKRHCAMMLTTHSMEEAEGLCDRLCIFVAGRLKTIGASAELKDRYGKYYKIQVTTDLEHEQQAREHLEKVAPGVEVINTLAGTATYEVSRDAVKLHEVFRSLESNKQRLHIRDWGISNTSTFT
jgi:ABC-type multidrug transport system ATPase subunit